MERITAKDFMAVFSACGRAAVDVSKPPLGACIDLKAGRVWSADQANSFARTVFVNPKSHVEITALTYSGRLGTGLSWTAEGWAK
jgi:hypothetical protein